MKHTHQVQSSSRRRAHPAVAVAALLALFGSAGCNGGGGMNGGGNGPTVGALQVQSAFPESGPYVGGTLLRITGTQFLVGETQTVLIGGLPATDVVVIDETTLACRTPAGTAGATVDVVVSNRLGQGRLAAGFSYLAVQAARTDVNGDGIADLIIAAPGDDAVGIDSGAVYVFFGSDSPIALQNRTTAQADLVIVGHHAGDAFGTHLCVGDVSGDGEPDLVVGANRVGSVSMSEVGAVYVFRGPLAPAASLSALAANVRLSGESVIAGDRFGSTVAIGDLDGDGVKDLMVGADGHDAPGKNDAGCVYVFRGGPTLVSKGAALAEMSFDGEARNDRAGDFVTCGDLNGDGFPDLVVCTQLADPTAPVYLANAGKVFVVWGGPSLSTRSLGEASAVFLGTDREDRFGTSATIADINNDGIQDLIVGAPLSDGTDIDAGKVYVFFGGPSLSGRWAHEADVILAGQPTHNSFGRALSTGDVNGDGVVDLVIGAPEADYLNDDNGRAYLFFGGSAFASAYAYEANTVFNGELIQGERFGSAVGIVDFNDDGFAEVISTSPRHDFGVGRAYMWLGRAQGLEGVRLAAQTDVRIEGVEQGAQFGTQVAR